MHISDNTVVSTSNEMFLQFTTDGSVTYAGFEIKFYGVHESNLLMSSNSYENEFFFIKNK